MLSASSLLEDGVLTVTGTGESDSISAHVEEGQLIVEVNDATTSLSNDDVRHINVIALGGNDSINIDASVRQTTSLDGGEWQ